MMGQIRGRGIFGGLRGLGQRLWAYRAAVSMATLVALTLGGVGQLQEIVEMSAATIGYALFPPPDAGPLQLDGLARVVLAVAVISYAPVMIWSMAVELYRRRIGALAGPGRTVAIVCALPILALMWHMGTLWWESGLLSPGDDPVPFVPNLVVGAFFVLPLSALLLLGINAMRPLRPRRLRGAPLAAWLLALAMATMIAALVFFPRQAGIAFGPFAVIGLFAVFLSAVGHVANHYEDVHGVPVTIVLVLCVVGFSAADLNDNHHIRLRPATLEAPMTAEQAFEAWLDCRPGPTEDVYLVAAQGGGLYAAYQSARFLGRIEDANPGFSSQVFAISGVSGGAVGATVFASIMHDRPRRIGGCGAAMPVSAPQDAALRPASPEDGYADAVAAVLGQDFLSPVGAAMLFPDFLARFSPWPVPPADRARALETAFEVSYARALWGEVRPDAGLSRAVSEHWSPAGDAPMLILNTTDVSTGTRMIASSPLMTFPAARASTIARIQRCDPDCALPRLSTAMLLSARFPVVTPAGSLALPPCDGPGDERHCANGDRTQKARFVDGGYFENSGLDTVADLLTALRPVAERRGVRLQVISFATASDRVPQRAYWLGEVLSPVRALNSARAARVEIARDRVAGLLDDPILEVKLDARKEGFTLGWVLSRATLARIDDDLYDPAICRPFVGTAPEPAAAYDVTDTEIEVRLGNCRVLAQLDALPGSGGSSGGW